MLRRKCSKCGLNRAENFFQSPKARVCERCKRLGRSRATKNARLSDTYEITMEDYDLLLEHQQGRCAICRGKRAIYDVDHDHRLEREGVPMRQCVRGLLCRRCNRRLLPAALDKEAVLHNAIEYLRSPPARDVL